VQQIAVRPRRGRHRPAGVCIGGKRGASLGQHHL